MTDTHKDIAKLSFEEALSELENIVRGLEAGNKNLDDSIANYSRGNALKKHCEQKLQEAKLKVDKIVSQADGSLSTEPLDN